MIGQARRAGDQLRQGRILAVQDTQRVAVQAPAAVLVQQVEMPTQVVLQALAIGRTRLARTQGVQFKAQSTQAQIAPELRRHGDQLGIQFRRGTAEALGADLVKLPVATTLRALVPKHRPLVPPAQQLALEQTMLDTGAHRAGGAFRAQRQAVAVAVEKGVHLLLDDIGDLADGTSEQFGRLEQRQPHLGEAVTLQGGSQTLFHRMPARRDRGQQVVHAAHGLKLGSHGKSDQGWEGGGTGTAGGALPSVMRTTCSPAGRATGAPL